jgi:lysozyme family protein
MPNVSLTPALRQEYETLFNSCVIRPERAAEVSRILGQITANRAKYDAVETSLGIPWSFTAVIHNMESSLSFTRHLHNGDPLTARTRNVPKDRPPTGTPPFAWEVSAADALTMKRLNAQTDWSLAGTLYQIERYNGWGYRLHHPHVLSPYLWSFSNHYSSGKYISDGTWSETAKSAQCGAAVLLRRMAELQTIQFADQPVSTGGQPLVVAYATKKSRDAAVVEQAEALQRWLNTFPGVFTKIDGIPGENTSDAFHAVTGRFLPGDPRS